jgi:hypothetical protein
VRRRLAFMLVWAIGWGMLPDVASQWWPRPYRSWVAGQDVRSPVELPVEAPVERPVDLPVPAAAPVPPALAATWARDGVRVNRAVSLHGTASPATGRLRLERWVKGTWRLLRFVPVAGDGSFRVSVRPTSVGFARYRVVRGEGPRSSVATLPRLDVYRLHTYVVRTRGHVRDVNRFAAGAAAVYADPRGWRRAHHRFARVRSGGDFTLVYSRRTARWWSTTRPATGSAGAMTTARAGADGRR